MFSIDDANSAVSRPESIRTFRIVSEDLTIEGGELTPTLKVKRGHCHQAIRQRDRQIYAQ
ncbi:MAG: hypothetical protein O6650_03275 [Actinobacteria bacterium]|nr:hypothetical protein [Actinomycetota bacterium]